MPLVQICEALFEIVPCLALCCNIPKRHFGTFIFGKIGILMVFYRYYIIRSGGYRQCYLLLLLLLLLSAAPLRIAIVDISAQKIWQCFYDECPS